MRSDIGGVAQLSRQFEDVLSVWDLGLNKPHVSGLSDLVASLLSIRSVNTIEMAQGLPRNSNSHFGAGSEISSINPKNSCHDVNSLAPRKVARV